MLANLVITLSAAVATLAIVDFLLSDAQKDWLSMAAIRLWSFLDELRSFSLVDWLKHPRAKSWLAIGLGFWLILFNILFNIRIRESQAILSDGGPTEDMFYVGIGSLSMIPVVFIVRPLFAALLAYASRKNFWGRLLAIIVSAAVPLPFFAGLLLDKVRDNGTVFVALWVSVVALDLVLLCALVIVMSIALAHIASGILYVGEFVVRRVAEYPKGPILALSVLLGGIVTIVKALG